MGKKIILLALWLSGTCLLSACVTADRDDVRTLQTPLIETATAAATPTTITQTETPMATTPPTSVSASATTVLPTVQPTTTVTAQPLKSEPVAVEPPHGADVEVIAENMERPVSFAFAPDGRIFFTEKETGNIRVIENGAILAEPVASLPTGHSAEQGLIGIVVDPDFNENHHLWVMHTLPAMANDDQKVNRVLRLTEQDNVAIEVTAVLTTTNTAGDGTHNAGNMVFGSDGMLYLSLGDDNVQGIAQKLGDPRGKIHRFMPTVPLRAPDDNPFYDGEGPNYDSIYAYGFRNPFDLTVDPLADSRWLFATENGPSCEDEVNRILAGGNYGWRRGYDCDNENGYPPDLQSVPPLIYWTPTSAPTGITVYTGDDFPQWYGDLFFCSFIDAKLHRLKLNEARDSIILHESINGLFCQTDVVNGPDGALYYLEGGGYGNGKIIRLFNTEKN